MCLATKLSTLSWKLTTALQSADFSDAGRHACNVFVIAAAPSVAANDRSIARRSSPPRIWMQALAICDGLLHQEIHNGSLKFGIFLVPSRNSVPLHTHKASQHLCVRDLKVVHRVGAITLSLLSCINVHQGAASQVPCACEISRHRMQSCHFWQPSPPENSTEARSLEQLHWPDTCEQQASHLQRCAPRTGELLVPLCSLPHRQRSWNVILRMRIQLHNFESNHFTAISSAWSEMRARLTLRTVAAT